MASLESMDSTEIHGIGIHGIHGNPWTRRRICRRICRHTRRRLHDCWYIGTRDGGCTRLVRTCLKYLSDGRGIGIMTSEPISSTCALLVLKVVKLHHSGHNECTYCGGSTSAIDVDPPSLVLSGTFRYLPWCRAEKY